MEVQVKSDINDLMEEEVDPHKLITQIYLDGINEVRSQT